jgi:hypothetical protein
VGLPRGCPFNHRRPLRGRLFVIVCAVWPHGVVCVGSEAEALRDNIRKWRKEAGVNVIGIIEGRGCLERWSVRLMLRRSCHFIRLLR